MSIIHRFTPPTCTLEIRDHNSFLSRWQKQQAIKNLGFKLSFDDPRISEEEQVTISGDREQLEQIYSLVLDYTENLLRKSFIPQLFTPSISSEVKTTPDTPSVSQGLVNYELSLGNILDKNSPQKIKLSALQLFDLVSALEEYKSKIAVVAELEETRKKAILPLWTKILATLVVIAGLTNLVFQLTKAPRINESTISLQEEPELEPETEPQQQPLADTLEVIPPQVPETEPSPTPQPKITEPLSSASSLPPPPAIDLPKPPPDIPNPENYPLPEVGRTVAPEIASFPDLKPPPLETPTTAQSESQSPQVESNIIVPQENSESKSLEIPGTSNSESETPINQRQPIALNPEKTIDEYIRDRLSRENALDSANQESNNTNNSEVRAQKPNTKIPEISQTKEVKSYFEQKWQPPAELTRTLEYRLILDKNGSIQRIIPIGRASEVYLDRTNLPLRGEA
ncbi:MAG: DUF4335 domain-containing protein, partial [Xenococcus sp. (in: cyanobacteria)]